MVDLRLVGVLVLLVLGFLAVNQLGLLSALVGGGVFGFDCNDYGQNDRMYTISSCNFVGNDGMIADIPQTDTMVIRTPEDDSDGHNNQYTGDNGQWIMDWNRQWFKERMEGHLNIDSSEYEIKSAEGDVLLCTRSTQVWDKVANEFGGDYQYPDTHGDGGCPYSPPDRPKSFGCGAVYGSCTDAERESFTLDDYVGLKLSDDVRLLRDSSELLMERSPGCSMDLTVRDDSSSVTVQPVNTSITKLQAGEDIRCRLDFGDRIEEARTQLDDVGETSFAQMQFSGVEFVFNADFRVDTDNDGVIDSKDACPDTGDQGRGITASGCPLLDSDGDGVNNAVDSCPDTAGSKNNGCPTFFEEIKMFINQFLQGLGL